MTVITETSETEVLTPEVLDALETVCGLEVLTAVCLKANHTVTMFSSNNADHKKTRFYRKMLQVGTPILTLVCSYITDYLEDDNSQGVPWQLMSLVQDILGPYEIPEELMGHNIATAKLALAHAEAHGITW